MSDSARQHRRAHRPGSLPSLALDVERLVERRACEDHTSRQPSTSLAVPDAQRTERAPPRSRRSASRRLAIPVASAVAALAALQATARWLQRVERSLLPLGEVGVFLRELLPRDTGSGHQREAGEFGGGGDRRSASCASAAACRAVPDLHALLTVTRSAAAVFCGDDRRRRPPSSSAGRPIARSRSATAAGSQVWRSHWPRLSPDARSGLSGLSRTERQRFGELREPAG